MAEINVAIKFANHNKQEAHVSRPSTAYRHVSAKRAEHVNVVYVLSCSRKLPGSLRCVPH